MSGPFLTGYTQTLNDWYDREIDSINEPYRPIPSGAISENEVITQIWVPLLGGLTTAGILDIWVGIGWIPAVVYIFCTSVKVKTKWMDWKLCPWSKLRRLAA
ncbi:UbiA family prenyltransferase [Medicago truncatula]|uniref:UbiA family prenyltransferase n=1 Tax=Medicago truncatula TaxID=3880 RepID=G7KSA3_MEDTR|nr:UbiA family prenyltransferase [Medicago truncatula]